MSDYPTLAALCLAAGCGISSSSIPPAPDSSDASAEFDVEAFCSDTPTGPPPSEHDTIPSPPPEPYDFPSSGNPDLAPPIGCASEVCPRPNLR